MTLNLGSHLNTNEVAMKKIEGRTNFFNNLFSSIKGIWLDPRIPTRDRWVIAGCLLLIISPFDFLPDFIPVLGVLDDLILISFVLDYFFNRLDENIILDHLNGGRKRFLAAKAFVGRICKISPQHALHFLWKYKKPKKQYTAQNSSSVKNVN